MTTRIGIISDTHFCGEDELEIPLWIREAFHGVDLIFHAGDFERPDTLSKFSSIAPCLGVAGNMDSRGGSTPAFRKVPLESGVVVMAHYVEEARRHISDEVFLLIYGHTHILKMHWENSVLFINPGSPSKPRAGNQPSVVVAEISGSSVNPTFKYQPR